MNTNKITIIGTLIIIVLLVSIPTTYKVIKNHQNKKLQVVEDKAINAAKECFYKEICKDTKITLKELYDNKLLDKISNPFTKEYYSEDSYISQKDGKFTFNPVE